MKWMRNRFLPLTYGVLLAALAIMGCTSKEDPSEVLAVCGNHSCGTVVMATSDTSSEGFHYLNPSVSPSGQQIMFTADWWAIPTQPRYDGDENFVNRRQVIVMPMPTDEDVRNTKPELSLEDQGATLIKLKEFGLDRIGGQGEFFQFAMDLDKGAPVWVSEDTVLFSMNLLIGHRLFWADISNPELTTVAPLYMEESDGRASPPLRQHLEPTLSPDRRWLAFTRSGCAIPDSFETCTGSAIWVMDMWTAARDEGYDVVARPVTTEYSRLEAPRWAPDGSKLIFSGGMDVDGGTGVGTEIFTMDFDAEAFAAGTNELDDNIRRLTYTTRAEGDPITGILNTSPVYSADMSTVYFVSTRRAPSITLHDRNIWEVSADGRSEPEIFFFSRSDDVDPYVMPDGRLMLSSTLGFTTELLNKMEEQAYQDIKEENETSPTPLDEVQMRAKAAEARQQLEFFEGVMSHLYIFDR